MKVTARKCILILNLSLLIAVVTNAQEKLKLTLASCYEQAQANYPLAKKRELIEKSAAYSIDNATKGFLPQLSINGQATYQSAVTQIPIDVAGIEVPQLTKDQYKIYGELNQSIYDGGEVKRKKEMYQVGSAIETQSLAVDLYHLKERVHQLFFGILLVEEQLKQNALLIKDIKLGISKIEGAIANGTALKSNADLLAAEHLKAGQQTTDLNATRKAYLDMLSLFLNQPLDTSVCLVKPAPITASNEINRPELVLYNYQLRSLDVQQEELNARIKPKLDFFFQGGYGRPALNILKPRFEAYYIGGLRARWNIAGLYTLKNEKAILENNRLAISTEKETFLFNTQYKDAQEQTAITRYRKLLQSDDAIIVLREKIKKASLGQLTYGTITTSDYLREVNAEDQARLNKIIHEIQLLSAQYMNQYTIGN